MKSVKIDIFNALKLTKDQLIAITNNPEITQALVDIVGSDTSGIKQIFSFYPPSTAVFPCAGFYRISGQVGSADGKLSSNKNELYSIDCMAKTMTATEDMEIAIDLAMDTLDWIVTAEHGPDLYEETTKVFHKVLRYRIKSNSKG